MSNPSEPPPPSHLHSQPDLASDILLWRKKQLNLTILSAATALWTVMEVYQYNFITVVSWAAMAAAACLFFWGTIHRLLKRETPDLSELEVSEEAAAELAESLRQSADEAIRFTFRICYQREWFVLVGALASLFLISVAARSLPTLTLLYIGVIGAMTVPAIYIKNENKITELGEKARAKSQWLHSITKQKFQEIKTKIWGQQKQVKEKKQE